MRLLLLALMLDPASLGDRAAQAVADAKPTRAELTAAVAQPAKDLGLVRDRLPAAVAQAAEGPYDVRHVTDCASLKLELRALERDLGADVDAPAEHSDTRGLAADLIKGALQLPFSGVVRRLSGATRREAAYRRAVAAAMVRRGFLRGRASVMGCPADPKGGPPE